MNNMSQAVFSMNKSAGAPTEILKLIEGIGKNGWTAEQAAAKHGVPVETIKAVLGKVSPEGGATRSIAGATDLGVGGKWNNQGQMGVGTAKAPVSVDYGSGVGNGHPTALGSDPEPAIGGFTGPASKVPGKPDFAGSFKGTPSFNASSVGDWRGLLSKYWKPGAAVGGTALGAGGLGHHFGYQSGGQDVGQAAWREGLQAGQLSSQSAQDNAGFFSKLFGQGGKDMATQSMSQLAGPQMTQAVVNQILARQ